ncbi:hypothetical protein [Actinosynnema pretiosum]|uniref:Uncharacterized protein n=1 Tax=Actinosynnema pretiosum TaxID=42197 RepID=A0A290Z547_9PSEU|nr:hypothetical protein [Actinosynnema pretiosum]ATE54118.1 hypothetical protein CNX65_13135 [Actinosynnema pretiosum]
MAEWLKLNPVQQKEVLDEMTGVLLESLPADWEYLELEHHHVGAHLGLRVGLRVAGGGTREWFPPEDVWYLFQDLRSGMYAEGQGTWFSGYYKLERPGKCSISYEWEREPAFSTPVPLEAFALDLERFPREPDYVPDWFPRATGQPTS